VGLLARGLVPITALVLLLLAPLVSERPSVEESEYLWMSIYTYELPSGFLEPGEHTFQYEFNWTEPRPGSLTGKVRSVQVDEASTSYRGFALLRPSGPQALVDTVDGVECRPVKTIHPDQPVRFVVAWVADEKFTQPQVLEHLDSMRATVRWDGGQPVPLVIQQTSISWEPLWNCDPWYKQDGLLALAPAGG
jgi:hypothetical protein